MRYLTKEALDDYSPTGRQEAERLFDLYKEQLDQLRPRLSPPAWRFFNTISLHDATLLAMHVGDDIDKRFSRYRTKLVNKRRASAKLEVLNYEETRLFRLHYRGIRRLVFDYPTETPWYETGVSAIDDWIWDELTPADTQFLCHEVLFSSGATLLIEFEKFSVKVEVVKERKDLPYV